MTLVVLQLALGGLLVSAVELAISTTILMFWQRRGGGQPLRTRHLVVAHLGATGLLVVGCGGLVGARAMVGAVPGAVEPVGLTWVGARSPTVLVDLAGRPSGSRPPWTTARAGPRRRASAIACR